MLLQAEIVGRQRPGDLQEGVSLLMMAPSTKRSASRLSGSGMIELRSRAAIGGNSANLAEMRVVDLKACAKFSETNMFTGQRSA